MWYWAIRINHALFWGSEPTPFENCHDTKRIFAMIVGWLEILSTYLVIFLICQGSEKYMENFFLKKGAQKIKPEINRLSSVPSTSWVSTLIQLLSLIEKRRRRGGVGWIACVFLRENWDAKRQGKYAPLHTVHFLCWKKCQMYYLRLCQLQSVCLPPIFSFLTSMFVVFLMRWWFF